MTTRFGIDRAVVEPPTVLRDARSIGLVCNQASVDASFRHAADALHGLLGPRLKALFGPQHGLWSTQQDNMIETGHAVHPRLGIPVFSLYSETRKPTQRMLAGLDLLVVDLQDVGTRVYTYVWTLLHCMEACAEARIPVLVLDRPNPLGGHVAEGPLLDPQFRSFVGLASIPMRHGLTMAELARHLQRTHAIEVDLHVLPMTGWDRAMLWPQTGRAWVPPSPNLPRFEGALVYPGQVLVEGTQLSEGRGTTTPFEQFGAPWLDPWRLLEALPAGATTGCVLRPVAFEPTFQKHVRTQCGGLFVHVTDPGAFRSLRLTLAMFRALRELWPAQFAWLQPPYEYEADKMPIDILTGGSEARTWVDAKGSWDRLGALADAPADWWRTAAPSLLYD